MDYVLDERIGNPNLFKHMDRELTHKNLLDVLHPDMSDEKPEEKTVKRLRE